MPTYIFYDTVTHEEYEEFMSISDLDEYKKMNPQVKQVPYPTAMVGDPVRPVALPIRLPEKLVAVATPVTTAPLGNEGAPVAFLSTILSALILDMTQCF